MTQKLVDKKFSKEVLYESLQENPNLLSKQLNSDHGYLEFLLNKESKLREVNLPVTFIFKDGQLQEWLFTSSKKERSEILKKNKKNFSYENQFKIFKKRKEHNLKIFKDTPSNDLDFRHFDPVAVVKRNTSSKNMYCNYNDIEWILQNMTEFIRSEIKSPFISSITYYGVYDLARGFNCYSETKKFTRSMFNYDSSVYREDVISIHSFLDHEEAEKVEIKLAKARDSLDNSISKRMLNKKGLLNNFSALDFCETKRADIKHQIKELTMKIVGFLNSVYNFKVARIMAKFRIEKFTGIFYFLSINKLDILKPGKNSNHKLLIHSLVYYKDLRKFTTLSKAYDAVSVRNTIRILGLRKKEQRVEIQSKKSKYSKKLRRLMKTDKCRGDFCSFDYNKYERFFDPINKVQSQQVTNLVDIYDSLGYDESKRHISVNLINSIRLHAETVVAILVDKQIFPSEFSHLTYEKCKEIDKSNLMKLIQKPIIRTAPYSLLKICKRCEMVYKILEPSLKSALEVETALSMKISKDKILSMNRERPINTSDLQYLSHYSVFKGHPEFFESVKRINKRSMSVKPELRRKADIRKMLGSSAHKDINNTSGYREVKSLHLKRETSSKGALFTGVDSLKPGRMSEHKHKQFFRQMERNKYHRTMKLTNMDLNYQLQDQFMESIGIKAKKRSILVDLRPAKRKSKTKKIQQTSKRRAKSLGQTSEDNKGAVSSLSPEFTENMNKNAQLQYLGLTTMNSRQLFKQSESQSLSKKSPNLFMVKKKKSRWSKKAEQLLSSFLMINLEQFREKRQDLQKSNILTELIKEKSCLIIPKNANLISFGAFMSPSKRRKSVRVAVEQRQSLVQPITSSTRLQQQLSSGLASQRMSLAVNKPKKKIKMEVREVEYDDTPTQVTSMFKTIQFKRKKQKVIEKNKKAFNSLLEQINSEHDKNEQFIKDHVKFLHYDHQNILPYTVLRNSEIDFVGNQNVILLIFDFMDSYLSHIKHFHSLIQKIPQDHKKVVLIMFNYPGQTFTIFDEDEVFNNVAIAKIIDNILFEVEATGQIVLANDLFSMIGFGYGGNIALTYGILSLTYSYLFLASMLHNSDVNTGAILLVNAFTYVDEKISQVILNLIKEIRRSEDLTSDKDLKQLQNFMFRSVLAHGFTTKEENVDHEVKKFQLESKQAKDDLLSTFSNTSTLPWRMTTLKGILDSYSLVDSIKNCPFAVVATYSMKNNFVSPHHNDILIKAKTYRTKKEIIRAMLKLKQKSQFSFCNKQNSTCVKTLRKCEGRAFKELPTHHFILDKDIDSCSDLISQFISLVGNDYRNELGLEKKVNFICQKMINYTNHLYNQIDACNDEVIEKVQGLCFKPDIDSRKIKLTLSKSLTKINGLIQSNSSYIKLFSKQKNELYLELLKRKQPAESISGKSMKKALDFFNELEKTFEDFRTQFIENLRQTYSLFGDLFKLSDILGSKIKLFSQIQVQLRQLEQYRDKSEEEKENIFRNFSNFVIVLGGRVKSMDISSELVFIKVKPILRVKNIIKKQKVHYLFLKFYKSVILKKKKELQDSAAKSIIFIEKLKVVLGEQDLELLEECTRAERMNVLNDSFDGSNVYSANLNPSEISEVTEGTIDDSKSRANNTDCFTTIQRTINYLINDLTLYQKYSK